MSVAALLAAGALLCAGPSNAQQLVTVHARPGATVATLELWQRRGACFGRVAGPWTAELGGSGLLGDKREGDGATPAGTFRIGATMYGIEANPGVRFAYHRLVCGDWWDEDPPRRRTTRSAMSAAERDRRFGAAARRSGASHRNTAISP